MKQPTTMQERRNWKGFFVDYDAIQAYEFRECLYCLTDAQVAVLGGIIEPLAWDTRWESITGQEIDKEWIRQFRDDIARRLMMSCCGTEGLMTRYTAEGHYQTSSDGGTTWQDAPTEDPRNSYPMFPPFVPPEAVDESCTHADGVVVLIRDQVTAAMEDGQSPSELLAIIISALAAVTGALITNPIGIAIIAIMGAVAVAIVSFGIPALQAALTTAVWDRLRCNIQSHVQSDGTFTQEDIDAIYNQIGVDETGITALYLRGIIAAMGVVGMSNASNAGFGAPDADCLCGDECDLDNFSILTGYGDQGVIDSIDYEAGTITCSSSGANPNTNHYITLVSNDASNCCSIISAEVTVGGTATKIYWDCEWPLDNFGGYHNMDGSPHCINKIQVFTTNALTVVFTFVACE